MQTLRVLPRDDGQDFQGSWMLHISGKMKSNHTTKQAAKNAARRHASDGDRLIVHRQDGTIQKDITVRDSSGSDTEEKRRFGLPINSGGFGQDTKNTAVDQFFR
jgi:hypothetical protein